MTSDVIDQAVKKTALYTAHTELGAKLVPFGGYMMPVSYPDGIQAEYLAVRKEAGLFDVSHMGEFLIGGEESEKFLQRITINDVSKLKLGDAQYSTMCYPDGGIVDDLLLYHKPEGYFMVVNAANIQKDFEWLSQNVSENVNLENLSDTYTLIALQGPHSRDILSRLTNIDLNMLFYTYQDGIVGGHSVMVSRTGYTGELGFEIYGDADSLVYIWNALINSGAKPAGLAARDILRMEMKYCLYGNDIDKNTNPIEAGLNWVTSLSKHEFIGKDVLLEVKKNGPSRKLIAFKLEERGIPRQGYKIFINSNNVGVVTSGTQSPILKRGIGLAYVDRPFNKLGQEIFINIRDQFIPAQIIKPPFIKDTSLYY